MFLPIFVAFFSLDICCEFLLMDGLKQKTFSLMGNHQYGVIPDLWKITRIQIHLSRRFCEQNQFFIYH